ncbi:MAG: type II toxin-antitoxin system RelE/ParE family toxin [Bacteroidetes bacterium]|nr:type II toxin-antitoxin system RelE/ParE family toxin [Bacteroidota bacterium]MCB0842448.1 type II toxin-antitoxin system RelE/ParE family toxin [Bacteroidota bacterium]MCB0851220.1 type II toxin-antitoxin system RelE/ParE family toxin [Bacteroidota bacterium]
MNYHIQYNPQSIKDLKEVLSFLYEIHPDLPRRFRSLLAENFEDLDKNPERWSPLSNGIRAIRMNLSKRLSYYCFYKFYEQESKILILRIIPQKADPDQWPKD